MTATKPIIQMNNWNILIVDDDIRLNLVMCERVKQEGFTVLGVHSGKEALLQIENKKPDLILIDYIMPGLGGMETIEKMKANGYNIPFIVITGQGSEEVAVEMMKVGAMDYLVKDGNFHAILTEKVKHAIEHVRIRRELEESKVRLEEREQMFRLMAENSVDAIWQMDLRMKFTYISGSCETVLGYTPDELIGRNLWEYAPGKEFYKLARIALNALKNPETFNHINFESFIMKKDGTEEPIEITGKLNRNVNGDIVGFQGSLRGISERVKARERIEYQVNLLEALVNNIPDQIYVKDTSSKYLMGNAGLLKELNLKSAEELVGRSDNDFFDEELVNEFRVDEEKVMLNGESIINKEEFTSYINGNSRWTLTTRVPLRKKEGNIIGLAGVKRDITHRKSQEEELIRSRYEVALKNKISNLFFIQNRNHLFQKLLETLLMEQNCRSGFIGYIDGNGALLIPSVQNIEFYNVSADQNGLIALAPDRWQCLWGDSLKQKRTLLRNEKMNSQEVHSVLNNAIASPVMLGKRVVGVFLLGDKPGGFTISNKTMLEGISNYIAPILDAILNEERMRDEREIAFNELKLAKERAEESDSLKSAFLQNLSHELRTPLNSILGFTNLLFREYPQNDKSRQYFEYVEAAGVDLIKMVEDTIDISKLESHDYNIYFEPTEINLIAQEIYAEFQKVFQKKFPDLEFVFFPLNESVLVNIDPLIFRKALSKVLDNAGKFTVKGRVEMILKRRRESVEICIEDTGIGIPADFSELVFEKFRRIVNKDVLYRGSGLGLPIAKGLLEAMSCNIRITPGDKKGTIVFITVPVK